MKRKGNSMMLMEKTGSKKVIMVHTTISSQGLRFYICNTITITCIHIALCYLYIISSENISIYLRDYLGNSFYFTRR